MINQLAVADYSSSRREEVKKQEQIKDLELKINTPMDSRYIEKGRLLAASQLGKKETLTQAKIQQAAELLYNQDIASYRSQLEALTAEEQPVDSEEGFMPEQKTDGGFSVKNAEGKVITREYAMLAKDKGVSTQQLAEAAGITVEQAQVLMGTPVQSRQKTQQDMIQEGGLINPFRARAKLQQSQLVRG